MKGGHFERINHRYCGVDLAGWNYAERAAVKVVVKSRKQRK